MVARVFFEQSLLSLLISNLLVNSLGSACSIPGLVNAVMGVVDAVRADSATPDQVKAQLDQISADFPR